MGISRFFKNNDGTLKVKSVVVLVLCIVGLFLVYFIYNNYEDFRPTPKEITTTTNRIDNVKKCDNCIVEFKEPTYTFISNQSINIEELLNLQKVNLSNVKCSIDNNIIELKSIGSKLMINTLDTLGESVITCTYEKMETKTTIKVEQDYINSASMPRVMYAYINKENDISINVSPKGFDLSLLDFKIEDEEIASLNENNKIIGNKLGVTKISYIDNSKVTSSDLYIVKNKINFLLKDKDGIFNLIEDNIITVNKNSSDILELSIEIEDVDNVGYNADSVNVKTNSNGELYALVTYEGRNLAGNNAYFYNLEIKYGEIDEYSYVDILFVLPDGSTNVLRVVS